MELFTSPELWVALLTLTALEIVLGIDNIIFITILAGKLPSKQQKTARYVGLAGAMLTRIGLLFSLSWIMTLTQPLFEVLGKEISGRDLILVSGGLFLIYKSVKEIHERMRSQSHADKQGNAHSLFGTIVQIMILDIVFSLDSVITAVGMVNNLPVMVAAIVIAVLVMMVSSSTIGDFVQRNPSIKVLALSFLLMIGVLLVGEGLGQHIDKGYVYFAMAFAFVVEMVNLRIDKVSKGAKQDEEEKK